MNRREVQPWTDDDVRSMRRDRDISQGLMVIGLRALEDRERVRRLVMRHPDLVARLGRDPIGLRIPTLWSGYVPPAVWNEQSNRLLHDAYTAIVTEAERRGQRVAA